MERNDGRTVSPHSGSWIELALVIATAAGHIVLEIVSQGLKGAAGSLNNPQQVYNLAACVAWGAYLLYRVCRQPQILHEWGLRKYDFLDALKPACIFCLMAVPLLLAYGVWKQHAPLPASFWLLIILYPLWGIAQQFALQNLVTRNLRPYIHGRLWRAVAATVLFSLAHFPNYWLMALVIPAGIVFTWIFERHRNLWAIGIIHGILGSVAYYLVLGEDPGAQLIQLLQSS